MIATKDALTASASDTPQLRRIPAVRRAGGPRGHTELPRQHLPVRAFSDEQNTIRTLHVMGDGTDELNRAVVHSKQTTPTGYTERSTMTVELNGDLHGLVLYQVTSVVDLKKNTLVNTGDQVFSGTIAGSEPVMLHDSKFRFDEDIAGGKDEGSVYLLDHIAGPHVRCTLKVKGTGKDIQGNPTFTYTGECTFGSG